MALAYIGLGSNLGDGKTNLKNAWQRIGANKHITLLALSNPYFTEPIDMESSQWFTNAVGAVETQLSPENLLQLLLKTELAFGRDRSKGKDRIVDLDVLYYDNKVMMSEHLALPHPEIANRLFVLAPLQELAPDKAHPTTGLTTKAMRKKLLQSCPDQSIQLMSWRD